MTKWSLPNLLSSFHDSLEADLVKARSTIGHPTEKGDASEQIWIDVFNKHLPRRYQAIKAHAVDSKGQFSEQMDVMIHDRNYSPLIFEYMGSHVVPAESIYAVFEAKQTATAEYIAYGQKKVASVRSLHRTTLPVPTVDGVKSPKPPGPILGGFLSLSSSWKPPLGEAIGLNLSKDVGDGRLDLGCIADAGLFTWKSHEGAYELRECTKPTINFLFELIAQLQTLATVPMLDIRAYAKYIA